MDVLDAYRAEQAGAKSAQPSTLQVSFFPDVEGQKLYVMCARRVPKPVLERLNQAITALNARGGLPHIAPQ